MLFFKRKKQEIRADTETSILTFFGITGEITRESAMNIPTVSACINKIGETVSRLPIKLFCRKNESVSEIKNDSRIRLLNGETGDTLSNVDLWKAAAEDYFLGGGAWIFVNSEHLKVKSLHYVDSRNISIISNNNPIFKAFRVLVNGTEYYDFKFIKLLRKTRDGYTNIPIQQENSRILSAAYNSLMLENMMNSSGCKPGFLKSKNRLSTEAIKAIKDGYRKVYDNQETREKVLVLNDGVEFEPISSTAAELQMNENKKTNSVEICKLFGFPHTIIDGGASEDDNKKFISAVISFLNQIETELDRVLLLETEKEKGFYFAFDTKELTRGNVLERYQAYEIARRNNILQIDEIRREEDFKPLNFDFLTLNLSDVLINPQTMEVFTPNTGQSKNLITGEQRTLELRHNPNHDDKGRFCSGGGGGNSAKPVDKSEKDDIIKDNNIHSIDDDSSKAYEPEYNFDSKVKPDVQQAFNEEYSKAVEKYGRITTINGVEALNTNSSDEGTYNDNSRIIELRHADKKGGLDKMAAVAQEKYKDGKWSTGNPRHAMRHEIGHAIQLEHKLNDSQWNEKLSKISEIFEKAINQTDGHKLPSKYSIEDPAEFISECIAGSYLNPKKQSKTVKEVSKIIIGDD